MQIDCEDANVDNLLRKNASTRSTQVEGTWSMVRASSSFQDGSSKNSDARESKSAFKLSAVAFEAASNVRPKS